MASAGNVDDREETLGWWAEERRWSERGEYRNERFRKRGREKERKRVGEAVVTGQSHPSRQRMGRRMTSADAAGCGKPLRRSTARLGIGV